MPPHSAIRAERHFGDRVVRCFVERLGDTCQALERAAAARPDADAVVFEGRRMSYRDLLAEVARVAAGLADLGVKPDDRVMLMLGNRPEFVVLLYAALRIGAIVVPVDIRLRAAEIAYMAGNCGARLIAHDERLAGEVPAASALPAGCATLAVPTSGGRLFEGIATGSAVYRHLPASEEDVAIIVFTSGTTGRPKGAMLTHLNIEHSCQHFCRNIGITADDRIGVITPVTHVTGLIMGVIGAVHAGAAILLLETFRAPSFIDMASRESMTWTVLVPAMYSLCLIDESFARADLSAWRIGNYGGAPMPEGVIHTLAERLPKLQLVNGYGASETCSPAAMLAPGEGVARAASVGRSMECADILIMDEHGCAVAAGEAGEIWIGGPMVSPGYWANPAATAEGFVGGYWRSGDVGSLDAGGYLRVHDRLKDVVNRGGYKVYSAEVESVLSRVEGVVEAAVVGRPDRVLGERVHAFVSVVSAAITAEALHAFCAGQLADYKVPETFSVTTDRLPRSPNGKVKKGELREIAATIETPQRLRA
jgi:long-chain acyl-CoA synthetase